MQIDSSTHLAPTQLPLPPAGDPGDRAFPGDEDAQPPQTILGTVDDTEETQQEATFLTIPTSPASPSASALALGPELFEVAGVDLQSLGAIPIPAAIPSQIGSGKPVSPPTDGLGRVASGGPATGESAATEPDDEEIPSKAPSGALAGEQELSEEDQREIEELKARDREVRQHEQAHSAVGGQYTRGGPRYEYTNGPDNKRYATGGEVSIDVSKVADNPRATIGKMQVVYRAAMAPAEPSSADRAIAAEAKQKEAEARRDMAEVQREERSGKDGEGEGEAATGSSSDPLPERLDRHSKPVPRRVRGTLVLNTVPSRSWIRSSEREPSVSSTARPGWLPVV